MLFRVASTITAMGSLLRFCWYCNCVSPVMNTSKLVAARTSSLPFFTSPQPDFTTVLT